MSVRSAASPRSISSQISASAMKSRPAPPHSVGNRRAEDAELAHPVDERHVELVLHVVLHGDGQDPLVDEASDGVLDVLLLFGEREVDGHASTLYA